MATSSHQRLRTMYTRVVNRKQTIIVEKAKIAQFTPRSKEPRFPSLAGGGDVDASMSFFYNMADGKKHLFNWERMSWVSSR